jgi:hypothetical protein
MTSPAEGIGNILLAAGVHGGATGWSERLGDAGDVPKVIAIMDSGGRGGEVKVAIDYPSVQIIVKGSSASGGYVATYNKAREVYDVLQGIDTPNATWDELVSCVAMNQPAWLGRDDKDRPQFSLNFRLITEPNNIGHRPY